LEKITVRETHRSGRRLARAGVKPKGKLPAQKITKGDIDAIVRKAQVLDDWSKKFGCRMGLVGATGLRVLRYLAYAFMAKGFACFPSYRWIASKTHLARSTVGAALRRLKHIGALQWTERQHRINGRRVQGTNLFTLHMPSMKEKLPPAGKKVAEAVASVVKSANLSGVFRETDKRTHGATTDRKSDRLEAALARLAAGMTRKAERPSAA
jgi:hypothetical protein